ncbi:cytochrome P450 [Artomyces pyxidatus]|uniref:Cytochrome P450 n=1 Tax=Artomyces pyxidatus TaxID=48021 RepID=A0ACB8STR9_9AGAM|nr:cytochrome P450 [Artomyces pyxidatus]
MPAVDVVNVLFCLGLLTAVSYLVNTTRSRKLPLPPIPNRLPIIGSVLSIPKHTAWKTYAEWSRRENSTPPFLIALASSFGKLSIVVNTKKAAKELYEGRSSVYADRPHLAMNTLTGWDFATAFTPYSDEWRAQRKIFHQSLNARAAPVHQQVQLEKVEFLIKCLYEDPLGFARHMRRYAASVTLLIAYGYDIKPNDDHFVEVAENAMKMISTTLTPVGIAVNTIPALRHLPDWFPGASFKTRAKECVALVTEMQNAPFAYVKRSMAEGTARPSVASSQIELNDARAGGIQGEKDIKPGADTTVSAFLTGVLALVLHPDVQQRARAELDHAVGRGRLPTFEDRPLLPYVTAICREILRWQVVFPMSFAHSSTEDDLYAGMFIPKGTPIILNAWAMLHNPEDYPDPESFKPDRFLTPDGTLNKDEVQVAFGLGRRNCVGMHMANATLWIMMASLLATFDISKAKDEHGNEIPVDLAYTDTLVSTPLPFRCSIRPRDREAEELIQQIASGHTQI